MDALKTPTDETKLLLNPYYKESEALDEDILDLYGTIIKTN